MPRKVVHNDNQYCRPIHPALRDIYKVNKLRLLSSLTQIRKGISTQILRNHKERRAQTYPS